jgi:hypothetical protein
MGLLLFPPMKTNRCRVTWLRGVKEEKAKLLHMSLSFEGLMLFSFADVLHSPTSRYDMIAMILFG